MKVKTILTRFFLCTGCIVLAVAAVLLGSSIYIICRHWTAIEQKVNIRSGSSFSQDFTVSSATWYDLVIEYQNTIPYETFKSSLNREFEATFKVSLHGTTIADSQTARKWAAGDKWLTENDGRVFTQILDGFDAAPGKTYHLDIHFDRDMPELAPALPLIKICVTSRFFTDALNATIVYGMIGLLLLAVGLFCIMPYRWTRE